MTEQKFYPHYKYLETPNTIFSITYDDGFSAGLTMNVTPANFKDDDYIYQKGIAISETAFGFIEPFILGPYHHPYSHYGNTPIAADEWKIIIDRLNKLMVSWHEAENFEDIRNSVYLQDDEIENWNFNHLRTVFINFCIDFMEWVEKNITHYPYLVVLGI